LIDVVSGLCYNVIPPTQSNRETDNKTKRKMTATVFSSLQQNSERETITILTHTMMATGILELFYF